MKNINVIHLKALEAGLDAVEYVLDIESSELRWLLHTGVMYGARTFRLRPFWLMIPTSSGVFPVKKRLVPCLSPTALHSWNPTTFSMECSVALKCLKYHLCHDDDLFAGKVQLLYAVPEDDLRETVGIYLWA